MPSKRPSRQLSQLVAHRAQRRCEYCLSPEAFSTQSFEVDHIIPHSKGGLTVQESLAFSCGCNSYKGDKTYAQIRRQSVWFHCSIPVVRAGRDTLPGARISYRSSDAPP